MKGIGSDIHQVFNQRKIHKVVLASQSSLFKEIFEAKEFSPKPVNPKIIRVRNVEPAVLEIFINFLYTGNVKVTSNNVSDILKLSEIFKVEKKRKFLRGRNFLPNLQPQEL